MHACRPSSAQTCANPQRRARAVVRQPHPGLGGGARSGVHIFYFYFRCARSGSSSSPTESAAASAWGPRAQFLLHWFLCS
jgi:hypothetical protein